MLFEVLPNVVPPLLFLDRQSISATLGVSLGLKLTASH
jgi:hypothetical protein